MYPIFERNSSFFEKNSRIFGKNWPYRKLYLQVVSSLAVKKACMMGLVCFPVPSSLPSPENEVPFQLSLRPWLNTGSRRHRWKLPRDPVRIGCDRSQVSSVFPAPSSSQSPDNKLPFELTRGSFIEHRHLAFGGNYLKIQSIGCDGSRLFSLLLPPRRPQQLTAFELTRGGHSLNTGVPPSAETT